METKTNTEMDSYMQSMLLQGITYIYGSCCGKQPTIKFYDSDHWLLETWHYDDLEEIWILVL